MSEKPANAGVSTGAPAPLATRRASVDADGLSPAELFERLAPTDWHASAARSFVHQGVAHERPPTVAFVRAICADVARVQTAEALARECATRLAAFGAPPITAVHWHLWSGELWRRGALPTSELGAPFSEATRLLRGVRGPGLEAAERVVAAIPRNAHLVLLASWSARWDLARKEPNPFEPALALHLAGFWLRGFSEDGVARVALPSLSG